MKQVIYYNKIFKYVDVELSSGEEFSYAEEALYDAMIDNNDCGCSLDNEFCFYPRIEDVIELDRLVREKASDKEIIDYCNNNYIYIGEYTKE